MPSSAILQPPRKKAKRKAKVVKKRQKTILVPSPSLLLSLLPSILPSLSPATPVEPTSADKVNEDEDENTKEPVEVEDKDIDLPPSPLLLPPIRCISV